MIGSLRRRLRRPLVALLAAASMTGCAGGNSVADAPPADDRLERTNRVAHAAFQHGQYDQAASLYQKVADLAYERDDARAAVDAQYNATVCLVRLDRVDEAEALLRRTKAEIARHAMTEPEELRLLEATIDFRQGRYEQAFVLTDRIVTGAPGSEAALRAQFLRGLIAAAQGDAARLESAIASLDPGDDERLMADRLELSGHLALIEGRYDASVAAFDDAARVRSAIFDYRGTVRGLTRAGEAAEAAGWAGRASVRYLRAGRSALQQGAHARARELLTRARALAAEADDEATVREADIYLGLLEEAAPGT